MLAVMQPGRQCGHRQLGRPEAGCRGDRRGTGIRRVGSSGHAGRLRHARFLGRIGRFLILIGGNRRQCAGTSRFPVGRGVYWTAINRKQARVGFHQLRMDERRLHVAGKQPQTTRRGAAKPHRPAQGSRCFGRGRHFIHAVMARNAEKSQFRRPVTR